MKPIIALIPTYGNRPYLDNMLLWLKSSGQVDDVIVYYQSKPVGSANARRYLVNMAYESYGSNALYLMLDDDCVFNEKSDIRYCAKLFDEIQNLGLVSIPLGIQKVENWQKEISFAYHCFMFSGKVIEKGINYSENEYADEFDFSINVYLQGFKMVITKRCAIWHHYSEPDNEKAQDGVNIVLIKENKIPLQSSFLEKYSDYIKCKTFKMLDKIELPKFSTIKVNKKGRALHKTNSLAL